MGKANSDPGIYHFNVIWLNRLNWLENSFVQTVTNSSIYRLRAFDAPNLVSGAIYALRIRKDDARDYWAEFRQRFTGNRWTQNGIILNWSPWESSGRGTHLLDITPGSPAGNDARDDSPLVIGSTFSDQQAGIHITPVASSAD